MAQQDITGLLTGIFAGDQAAQQQKLLSQQAVARNPNLLASTQTQIGRAPEQLARMRQSVGGMFGQDLRSGNAKAAEMMASLDERKPADQEKILQIVSKVKPEAVPALRSRFATMNDERTLKTTQREAGADTREAIASQVRAAGYPKMADAIVKEALSGSDLALKGGIKVLTNLAQSESKTMLTLPEQMEQFRMEKGFEADLAIASKAETTAQEQSAQYSPILEQMQALTETVDFGPGSTSIAAINSTLHSLAEKAGLNPKPLDPSVAATATYNSLSKRLKAWLLEAQKGAISNLENNEITKNTANPNMTKDQARALVNFSEASLMSANNKAQEQKTWLRDNGTLIGFEKSWGKYIEDFPRTEGFLTLTDISGTGTSIQANFKPIEGNMELFSLYAANKGNPPTFLDKRDKGFTLQDVKREIIQDEIDQMKIGNPDFKPTKEQLSLYKLNARRKVGALISLRLNSGTYRVTK